MKKQARFFILAAALAGPIYIALGIAQIFMRPGFDPTRHDLSLMSNGELGWIQIVNFLFTGVLVIAGAVGVRQLLRNQHAGKWAPIMLGLYGLGLIGAGIFVADPMNGFPVGTPEGAPTQPTINGLLHIITGALGFIGLIAACFVFARRFAAQNQRGWMVFSIATGIVFLASFMGIAGDSQQSGVVLQTVTIVFTIAVVWSWAWLTGVMLKLKKELQNK